MPVNRPLSPHIQIYKPQITSLVSITHRATGIFLFFGALFLSCWLISATYGPEIFHQTNEVIRSWPGLFVLFGLTASIFFHLANGIRHLCWDFGKGFELNDVRIGAWIVIIFTIFMTAIIWVMNFLITVPK